MLKQMRSVQNIKDVTLSLLQDAVSDFVKQLYNKPQLDSIILKDVPLASGANLIPHRLDRAWQGYKIIDLNSNVTIWRSSLELRDKYLTLSASGACIVSIEVF